MSELPLSRLKNLNLCKANEYIGYFHLHVLVFKYLETSYIKRHDNFADTYILNLESSLMYICIY